jgi:glycogen debranching enzyme
MVKRLDRDTQQQAQRVHEIRQRLEADEAQSREGQLSIFQLPGDGLSMGASLGNSHCWITTRGRGEIDSFFSTDLGRVVMGSMLVRLCGPGASPLQTISPATPHRHDAYFQLYPAHPGTIVLHPAYQQHIFELAGNLHVRQTIFVPKQVHAHDCAPKHADLQVAYQRLQIANLGSQRRSLRLLGFVQFRGDTEPDIRARYDKKHGALLASNESHPDWVRVFGATLIPTAYETSADAFQIYKLLQMTPLRNRTDVTGGYVLGGLQVDLDLEAGEERDVAFVEGFSVHGEDAALTTFGAVRDADAALERTISFYEQAVKPADVLTPDPIINSGALWAKVNMLRVMADYPTGPAFTNDPSRSSAVVGRDAFWMVHGADYLADQFSCHLLRNFATRQEEKGEILEFYDAVTGEGEDDGLNINDNTPLFILALHHHWRATGHRACLEEFYPNAEKAARYILSQLNEQGLVWCTSTGEETQGIIGWRNIIPHYRISGAVTEVNVECAEALRTISQMAQALGHLDDARTFKDAGAQLVEAINRHLLDRESGYYYLNIDVDGSIRTDVTADEVFPVIWGVAPPEVAFNIVRRINTPEFLTEAGVRTASTASAEYDPGGKWGLQGGVWPGMTWWYAFAAARYYPGAMAAALHMSFAHYAKAPVVHNTVPGQFSEWFDGDSLVNRGMRLSPWEAPRYMWAAVEGACGVELRPDPESPFVEPMLPPTWKWIGLRNLPFHHRQLSYFAGLIEAPGPGTERSSGKSDGRRAAKTMRIFSTTPIDASGGTAVEVYDRDITDRVGVINEDVRVAAFERSDEIIVCVGNTSDYFTVSVFDLDRALGKHRDFNVRIYDSEMGAWSEPESRSREDLEQLGLNVQGKGFRIVRLRPGG